ncbi:MAG: type II toxin-antitoxin system prevent-host-death family antitoxin [Treponema sp.]|nr:type II toxin-antitoxin system prevent-host-death family antitoxin [Treponema sp.]
MCNAVPVFQAKNRLPFYIHLAETEGPVPIMRRNEEVAYIISKEDSDELRQTAPKEKSLFEELQESRREWGLEDDDFDYTEYFDNLRDRTYYGRPESEHIFDDVAIDDGDAK